MSIHHRPAFFVALALAGALSLNVQPALAQVEEGCVAAAPKPAKKRGLGGLLSGARRSTLLGSVLGAARGEGNLRSDLAGAAESAVTQAAAGSCSAPAEDTRPAEATIRRSASGQPTVMNQSGPVRPTRAASVTYPSDLPTPPEKDAEIKAYDDLAYVRCFGCEGGKQNEGFHGYAFNPSQRDDVDVGAMMEAMQPGDSRSWRGTEVKGRITKVGEETQNGFRCMRFRLHIDRGARSAERDKLYCWGRQNQFHSRDQWIDIY